MPDRLDRHDRFCGLAMTGRHGALAIASLPDRGAEAFVPVGVASDQWGT
jgi:hypothetical protein